MTTTTIDASAIRCKEGSIAHTANDGSVYSSNPATPLLVPLPLAATGVITGINVYIAGGAGGGTVTIALDLHDIAARTVTVQGTPDTVAVAGNSTKAVTVPGTFTPAAHQVARLAITGTNKLARISGVEYTF